VATNVKRKKKAEVMSDDGSMTLTGHLKELRNRLIICAAVFVVGVIGFLAISDKLIDLLTAMAMNANYTFVFLAPQEKLMQYFRVSLIAAVIVTIPVALYQVYAFAKPGLKRSESFFFRLVLLFGLALFCVGVLFAYKVTLPFMLNFLVTLEGTDYITASISIESYINLCLTMFIIFGCVFEMPLVTIILAKMGIANPEIMKKGRGVAIVLIFMVAAIERSTGQNRTADTVAQRKVDKAAGRFEVAHFSKSGSVRVVDEPAGERDVTAEFFGRNIPQTQGMRVNQCLPLFVQNTGQRNADAQDFFDRAALFFNQPLHYFSCFFCLL
jgi:sec-independent protein translocase protein TatC